MSLLTEISRTLPEPTSSQLASAGVHLIYVMESYIHALRHAKAAGLEVLLEAEKRQPCSMVSLNHYWPPLQHNQLSRGSPQLFHEEEGLGGVSELDFASKGVCIIVDNGVDTGKTLWMAGAYLLRKGYNERQVLIAADVWHNGRPRLLFEVRPFDFFAPLLATAEQKLLRDLTPFLSPTANGSGNGHHSNSLSLPQTIASYCRAF